MSSHRIDRRRWCQGVLAFTGLAAARVSAAQQKPAVLDPLLDDAIRRGATMEEVAKLKGPVAVTPEEAIRALKTGNARFFGGQAQRPQAAIRDEKARMREAVIANVRVQVQKLKQVNFIQDAIRSKKIAVIGAFYEITSGAVDFLETEEDLRVASRLERVSPWRAHLS